MKPVINAILVHVRRQTRHVPVLVVVALCWYATPVAAQSSFNSGSDGSDGLYAPAGPPGTIIVFDPTQFHGSQVAANIFNFTTISIPAGVTIQFPGDKISGPIVWLSQGDVTIQGTLDLSGGKGHDYSANPFVRVPSTYGAGGYRGEIGGNTTQLPLSGDGPTGGAAAANCPAGSGAGIIGKGGTFPGNQFLIPLIGGSGGGGSCGSPGFGPGGGGGGGAILIASSTKISILNGGVVNTNGGGGGGGYNNGGGGSGGAIRLVANIITTSGTTYLSAAGGCGYGSFSGNASHGVLRIEAFTIQLSGSVNDISGGCASTGTIFESSPFPLLLATAGRPSASVISISGVPITPNPSTFPDITINTTAAVPVVIQTHNVPTTATITLTILDQNGVADTSFNAPPLTNCDQNNFCTTIVNVVFPFGASRGLTKVTWTP